MYPILLNDTAAGQVLRAALNMSGFGFHELAFGYGRSANAPKEFLFANVTFDSASNLANFTLSSSGGSPLYISIFLASSGVRMFTSQIDSFGFHRVCTFRVQ